MPKNLTTLQNLVDRVRQRADMTGSAFVSGTLKVETLSADTVISSSHLIVRDPIIGLGFGDSAGETGSAGDRGFIFGLPTNANQAIIWDQSSGSFLIGKAGAAGPGRSAFDIPTTDLTALKVGAVTSSRGGYFADRVGIGPVNPSARLHVSSSTGALQGMLAPMILVEHPNDPGEDPVDSTKPIMCLTASTGAGRLGINTNSPAGELDVRSDGASTLTVTQGNVLVGTDQSNAQLYVQSQNENMFHVRFDNESNQADLIYASGSHGTPYVGIGTATPTAVLHVSGTRTANPTFRVDALAGQSQDVVTVTQKTGATCFQISHDGTTTITDLTQTGGSIDGATIGATTAAPVTMTAGTVAYSGSITISPYAVVATDYILGIDTSAGALEVDLPAASGKAGRMLVIKDVGGSAGTNNITVDPNGSEKIDGQSSLVIAANSGSAMIFCDGSHWFIAGTR